MNETTLPSSTFSVMLRIEDFGDTPQLLHLADFNTRKSARRFMDALRPRWGTATYIEERCLDEEDE